MFVTVSSDSKLMHSRIFAYYEIFSIPGPSIPEQEELMLPCNQVSSGI